MQSDSTLQYPSPYYRVPELRNQIAVLERLLNDKAEPAPSPEEQSKMEKRKKKLVDQVR